MNEILPGGNETVKENNIQTYNEEPFGCKWRQSYGRLSKDCHYFYFQINCSQKEYQMIQLLFQLESNAISK